MATFLVFLGSCLLISGLLVALAAWRIRAVALKQAGKAAAPSRRWLLAASTGQPGCPGSRGRRSTATPSFGVSGNDSGRHDSFAWHGSCIRHWRDLYGNRSEIAPG